VPGGPAESWHSPTPQAAHAPGQQPRDHLVELTGQRAPGNPPFSYGARRAGKVLRGRPNREGEAELEAALRLADRLIDRGGAEYAARPGGASRAVPSLRVFKAPLRADLRREEDALLRQLAQGHVRPTDAGYRYQELVARDLGASSGQGIFTAGRHVYDIGNRHEVTLQGASKLDARKARQILAFLRDAGTVNLTVPTLSAQARRQLERLLSVAARSAPTRRFMLIVRETR